MAANFFDQFDPASAKPEGGGNFFDQFDPGSAKPAPAGGTLSDLGKSLKAGVQRLPGAVAGLADLPIALATGARPFTAAADALGEATGFQPGKWADETKFSAGYEQGRAAVDKAWEEGGAGNIARAYLANPGYTANQVAESLPGTVAGGLAGRVLMGAGAVAGRAATAAAPARAAVPGALERAVGERAATAIAAGAGEGAVTAGQQMAEYQGEDAQRGAAGALGAGLGTALIGAGAGRVANAWGLETAETALVRAGRGAGDNVPASAKRRILGGMVSEALLQELPQSAQEQMWSNWAEGKPLMEGVARAGTEGALAGGVMGAGANLRGPRAQQPGPAPDAQPQPDAAPLQLGHTPDPLVVFPDGTVGRRAEVDAYLASLPEDQQTAARAALYGYAAQPAEPTTSPGAADPAAQPERPRTMIEALQAETALGAQAPRDGIDFTREFDHGGLTLQDPAETERARAASIDYEATPIEPQWETAAGAAPERLPGLDMPAREVDVGTLELDTRTPSQRLGIDPAAGPLSRAATQAVDAAPAHPGNAVQLAAPAGGASAYDLGVQAFRSGAARQELAAIPNVATRLQHLRGYDDAARQAGAGSGPGPQAQAPAQGAPMDGLSGLRPEGWRKTMLKAVPVAQALGIDTKGKRLAQVVAEVEALDARAAHEPPAPANAAPVLQNRNRATPSSIAQMQSIAARPDYGRMGPSRDFANGAPVVAGGQVAAQQLGRQDVAVASDGRRIPVQYAVVEAGDVLASHQADGRSNLQYGQATGAMRAIAGNGRIAGIQAAHQRGTASDYVRELAQDAAMHGIDPALVQSLRAPVLVRVMPAEAVTDNIGDVSNTQSNLQLSATEQADNDVRRINLDALQFADDGAPTAETVRQFVRAMPATEQGALIDTNGQPTAQAIDRLNAAIFARAYGNGALVRLYAQAIDPEARLVLSALARVAPKMARLEGAGALDIRDVVAQAAEIAVNARRQGVPLGRVAEQLDMAADPLVGRVLALFARNPRSNREAIERLSDLADLAYAEATKADEDMFGAVPRLARAQVFDRTLGEASERASEEDLAQPAGRAPVRGDAGGPAAHERGAPADAGAAQASRAAEDGQPAGQGGAFELSAPTRADILARQEEQERQQAQEAAERQRQDEEDRRRRERDDIRQRSEAAADTFELGQDALVNLTGQGDIFAAPAPDAASAPAAPAAPAPRGVLAKKAQAEQAARADYFAPGNIVRGYDGSLERVLAYSPPSAEGAWSVRVMPVERSGVQWRDVPERARTHSTAPTARELKDGPVERAPADVQAQEQAPKFSRSAPAEQALPEAAQQLKDTERAYGGRAAYDRAKAAGKTKLAYGQWVQVRTPNFKAWFGDWESDPAGASKVVDPDTGEPMVVYHGGTVGNVFSTDYAGSGGGRESAFFFTPDIRQAKDYAGTGSVKEVFISLRDPVETDVQLEPDEVVQAKADGKDGYWVIEDGLVEESEIAVFSSTQVKSATNNNGNFDGGNPDIRRSFAGQQAATADQHALASAQQRLEAGEDAEAVRRGTGWHRGADGKWRFEISDADARLKVGHKGVPVSQLLAGVAQMQAGWYRLADLLDHPALFAAYPDLAAMPVKFMPGSAMGQADGRFNPSNGTLYLHEDLAQRQALSTLLHEIQHGIQHIEGFAMGGPGGTRMWLGEMRPIAEAEYRKLVTELTTPMTAQEYAQQAWQSDTVTPEIQRDYTENFLPAHAKSLKTKGLDKDAQITAGWRAYKKLAGEVEARNTQARQNLTDAQRRATPPSQTADVADTDVIVTFNGQEMASAPMPANAAGFDFDAMRRTVLGEGAAAAPSGATTTQVAGAIRRAYGSLLDKLQAKGLVTLVQSEDEAVEAAAQARAAKTGEALERARASLMASVQSSRSPMKSVEANIRRGREALARALDGKTSVHRAMYRNGLGWVDFVWGDEGGAVKRNGSRPGEKGIAHILEARQRKDGLPEAKALRLLDGLIETIANGAEVRRRELGGSIRAVVGLRNMEAIVVKTPGSNAWMLTGWEVKPDATAAANDTSRATHDQADSSDLAVGAGESSVAQGSLDIKRSAAGAVEGFFDPVSGQSFLVADGLSEATAPGTLMHEVGIHMAADGTLAPLFERAQALVQEGGSDFLRRVKARMESAGEASAEEAAAYIVTEYENARALAPASVRQWVRSRGCRQGCCASSLGISIHGSSAGAFSGRRPTLLQAVAGLR